MTSISDKARDRLGKLIPRLASDQDPEVLATVHAMRSTLRADGLDLHDLAAAIGGSEAVSKMKPAQVQQAPSWAHLSPAARGSRCGLQREHPCQRPVALFPGPP